MRYNLSNGISVRIYKMVLVFISLFFGLTTSAQKKDLAYYQCAFFESYRAGNMAPWPDLIEEMAQVKSADVVWQTEMVKAMYGLVGYQIGPSRERHSKNICEQSRHLS